MCTYCWFLLKKHLLFCWKRYMHTCTSNCLTLLPWRRGTPFCKCSHLLIFDIFCSLFSFPQTFGESNITCRFHYRLFVLTNSPNLVTLQSYLFSWNPNIERIIFFNISFPFLNAFQKSNITFFFFLKRTLKYN